MKKISSVALALILVFGSCFSVFAAEGNAKSSVPADAVDTAYETAVKNLMDDGIVSGYPDGLYHPEGTVNRAEACVMVVKAMKPDPADLDASTGSLFEDMDGFNWAVPYVNYAVSRGIVSGVGNNEFQPSSKVTYIEVSAMMINAMGYTASDLKGTWPDNYNSKARDLGLYKVVANPSALSTKLDANRGDVANMLYSVSKEIEDADIQPIAKQEEEDLDPQLKDGSPQAELIEKTKENIVPTMTFTGTQINLSLKDAITHMQTTGPGFEAAVLNQEATLASALGKGENASSLRETQKMSSAFGMMMSGVDFSQADQAKLARDYLRKKAPVDYEAEMNQLQSDAVQSYYGVLIAQSNYDIEKENLQVQEELLNNTQSKFDQGMVAKIDVISAETAVESAKSSVESALTKLNLARMNFNVQLNYPLMQNISLTDSLEKVDSPTMTLEEAIAGALNNRHELKDARFDIELKKMILESTGIRYPSSSATYKTAKVNLLTSEKTYNDAVKMIEMDIRKQYMELSDDAKAIESAKATLANAQEGLRITQLSFDAGLKTLSDVQEMQVKVYQAELLLASKINDYDLKVFSLQNAASVGTSSSSGGQQ